MGRCAVVCKHLDHCGERNVVVPAKVAAVFEVGRSEYVFEFRESC